MVKRKGFGYILEAFVSSLVVLVFVLGSYQTTTINEQSPDVERQVAIQDVTFALQRSNYLEKIIQNGDPELTTEIISAMMPKRNQFQASLKGPPTGHYSVGIYTPPERLMNSSVEPITSDDRCSGDLDETNSEFDPVHTNSSSSIETTHGVRLYFTDRDTQTAEVSGFNGIKDYDSFYVDRNADCQFPLDEGPYNLKERIKIENNTVKSYQINSVESNTFFYYETPLSSHIDDHISNYTPVRTEIRNINFSDGFDGQDLMIFSKNKTLDRISSNKDRFEDFAEEKPVLMAMDLNKTMVENGVLDFTGLGWVNLTYTSPPGGDEELEVSSNSNSRRIAKYLNEVGYNIEDVEMEPGGKVSSDSSGRIEKDPLVRSGNFRYETDEWDYENSSLQSGSVLADVEDLSDCDDAHREGVFELPTKDGIEELTAFNTKLDGDKTSCNLFGVTIDKNNDGKIQDDETTFLDGEITQINGRDYRIVISSHESVKFEYAGNYSVEYLNLRREFDDGDAEKFARLPRITENSPNSHLGLLTASSLFLLEGERTVGSEKISEGVSARTAVPTENGVHKISVRWLE